MAELVADGNEWVHRGILSIGIRFLSTVPGQGASERETHHSRSEDVDVKACTHSATQLTRLGLQDLSRIVNHDGVRAHVLAGKRAVLVHCAIAAIRYVLGQFFHRTLSLKPDDLLRYQ